jgi:hypothetical protein
LYREQFVKEEGFEVIGGRGSKPEVKVRVVADPQAGAAQGQKQAESTMASVPDQLVLCKSQGRRDKELTIRSQAEEELLGCYVLRTNRQNIGGQELWELYMTLTRAEAGFKALKSDLGLRPNYHRLEERVDGHVFITVLAYHLLNWIMHRLEVLGDDRGWRTIKRILQTHCYTTILLPTKGGKLYRLRKAGEPEQCQQWIYRALGVEWKNLPCPKIIVAYEDRMIL